jgi:predicted RNase H-like HicB family nuclease
VNFGASVPDLPGCFGAGDTIDRAIEDVYEAIEAHVELMAQSGQDVPIPRTALDIAKIADQPGATWVLVDVPVERFYGPAEKINITVPALVLRKIDAYAVRHGETRSGFLVRAAQAAIGEGT